MSTLTVLVRARALIEKPEAWTKEAMARDVRQAVVRTGADAAACFCLAGALYKVSERDSCGFNEALDLLTADCGVAGAVYFNDAPTTSHSDVLALFDRAIERLRRQA